jgi:predicted AAA+ superfamily ATPase
MFVRKKYIEQLLRYKDLPIAKAIVGIRRSGKSNIVIQYIDHLIENLNIDKKQIIYIDFEDFSNENLLNAKNLFDFLNDKINKFKNNKKIYIFLDEIQKVEKFESIISTFYKKTNIDLYITGSNSFLLDNKRSTLLTGRTIPIYVFPFSFKEFYQNYHKDKISHYESFDLYLKFGGMPFVSFLNFQENEINQYISSIDSDILVKDIAYSLFEKKINVNNVLLTNIKKYIYTQCGNSTSVNSIRNNLKQNNITIYNELLEEIIESFCNSFQLYKVNRYDLKGNLILKTDYKYYVNDHSFRNIFLSNYKENLGFLLENIVYFELLRRDYIVYIGKNNRNEIDFIAIKNDEKIYIQVTKEININNQKREIDNLSNASGATKKILLSLDEEEKFVESIYYKNLIK